MDTVRRHLRGVLDNAAVVDPHCHLTPASPAARSLADIVLYHHVWIELVSSGMPQRAVSQSGLPHELAEPGIPAIERVRRSLGYLGNVANTTAGLCLRWILRDLYGLTDLNENNLDLACSAVEERASDPTWPEKVLVRHCGIAGSITVESGGEPFSPSLHAGREGAFPINMSDGKHAPPQMLRSMEDRLGREIKDVYDYKDLVLKIVGDLPTGNCQFIGFWPLPYLTLDDINESEISAILRKAKASRVLTRRELGSFSYFAVTTALDALRSTSVRTIQLIVGADVLPPHRSITAWSERLPGALARIAGDYEDFHFNISTASDVHTQDLGILAKHMPNISVAGYWWHTFYPYYIRKALETRLDMVPINKIIGFFSDAYHCEWCYPKLKMVKGILEDIMVERVAKGWYTMDLATEIVSKLLYENPKAIYGLAD